MTEIPLNTYIEWTKEDRERGKCPVPAGSDVTVYLCDGFYYRDNTPEDWDWMDEAVPKIIAYEVHMKHYPKVTRVEYVEKNGKRHVITYEAEGVTLAFQDDDRTLKVFIEGEKK